MTGLRWKLFAIAMPLRLPPVTVVGTSQAHAQECQDTPEGRICTVTQPIVAGTLVDADTQRRLGLITVSGGCSGTLLNRYWVLTARHCVTRQPPVAGSARTVDDPISNPLQDASQVSITADWAPGRTGRASRIYEFAANRNAFAANVDTTAISDIVLVYLGAADLGPVDSQRIYAIALDHGNGSVTISGRLRTTDTVTQYGRGFATLATGTFGTPTAQQAQGLGQYRSGRFTPSNIDANTYRLTMNGSNQVGHGGDSGGPTVVTVANEGVGIAGVQSTCNAEYLAGAPQNWSWASRIRFCTYVSTEPFMSEILAVKKETPECPFGAACALPAVVQYVLQ